MDICWEHIWSIFDYVLTPKSFGLSDGYEYFEGLDGKNKMIKFVQNKQKIPNGNILLIDDNKNNIERAKKEGYKTLFVKLRRGMTENHVRFIHKFVHKLLSNK